MKGKAAYAKAQRAYRELKRRNDAQAETTARLAVDVSQREEHCSKREKRLIEAENDLKRRLSWPLMRRIAFLFTGR